MKLHEISHLSSMVSDKTDAIVRQGDIEFILDQDWGIVVEAPDGHVYQLNKNWTAKDLVEFVVRYPLGDENCTLMFLYGTSDDYDDICLIPSEVNMFLHGDEYELQFVSETL